jgi:hypothetical protein
VWKAGHLSLLTATRAVVGETANDGVHGMISVSKLMNSRMQKLILGPLISDLVQTVSATGVYFLRKALAYFMWRRDPGYHLSLIAGLIGHASTITIVHKCVHHSNF